MKSVKQIFRDLGEKIKTELPVTGDDSWRYEYDRPKWITKHREPLIDKDIYLQDLETLRVMIYQIHYYGYIIHTDGSGRNLNNHKLIEERKYEKYK